MRRGLGLAGHLDQAGHVQPVLAIQEPLAVAQADHAVAIGPRALVQKEGRVGPHRAKALHDHPDGTLGQLVQGGKLGQHGQIAGAVQHRLQGDHHAARRRAALVDLGAAHARRLGEHIVQPILDGNEGHVLVVRAHVGPRVVDGDVAGDQPGETAHRLPLLLDRHRPLGHDARLAAAKGDVGRGVLHGHTPRQRGDGGRGDVGRQADAAQRGRAHGQVVDHQVAANRRFANRRFANRRFANRRFANRRFAGLVPQHDHLGRAKLVRLDAQPQAQLPVLGAELQVAPVAVAHQPPLDLVAGQSI